MCGTSTSTHAPAWSKAISAGCAARSIAGVRSSSIPYAAVDIASVRLPRLFRTSSFRLTLLYAAVSGSSALLLLGIGASSVTGFMSAQIDATTASELAEVQADAGRQSTDALRQVIEGLTVRSPGIFYLLQSADGHV